MGDQEGRGLSFLGNLWAHPQSKQEDRVASPDKWWYNHKTGEVELGPQSLGMHRDGPFDSAEEAVRAPEIARQRSAEWDEEEKNS